MRLVWVLTVLGLGATACAEEPGPEEVVRQVTLMAEASRTSSSFSFGYAVFPSLTADSITFLEECAVAINGKLGRDLLSPQECIGLQRFLGKRGELEVTSISSDAKKASVRLFSGDVVRTVELRYEEGWKVDLLSSLAANGTP